MRVGVLCILIFAALSLGVLALASDPAPEPGPAAGEFARDVGPLLAKYCADCHGEKVQEASLRLDELDPDLIDGDDADQWREVLDRINTSEMPPPEHSLQLADPDREAITNWLTSSLREAVARQRAAGGRNVTRRLTSYEYSNTLRDLLGLDLDYAASLPPEVCAAEGFQNNSSVLQTSASQLEHYEEIARTALERILVLPAAPPPTYRVRVEPERRQGPLVMQDQSNTTRNAVGTNRFALRFDEKNRFGVTLQQYTGQLYRCEVADFSDGGTGAAKADSFLKGCLDVRPDGVLLRGNRDFDHTDRPFEVQKLEDTIGASRTGIQPELQLQFYLAPLGSPIRVRVKAGGTPGRNGAFPRFAAELGVFKELQFIEDRELCDVEVRAPIDQPELLEFHVQGDRYPLSGLFAKFPQLLRLFNGYHRGTSDISYDDLPKLFIDWVEIEFDPPGEWPPASYTAIVGPSSPEGPDVGDIVSRFLRRAFRRPPTSEEVTAYMRLFDRFHAEEPDFHRALVSTLTAALCSPHFLMLLEPQPESVDAGRRPLDDHEVAVRLSYYLWGTMPDAELFRLADENSLHTPDQIRAQFARMLSDPRSAEFSRNFATQWLNLGAMHSVAVNPEFFEFPEELAMKAQFERESIAFVDHVLRQGFPITTFIDSDFALLTPELAAHYRIPGVAGSGFEPVSLPPDSHHRGLLTHAAIMLANSDGGDTHPIKRGVWLLERLLNDPPPPPPPVVPPLPKVDLSKLSLQEKLKVHADSAGCRSCHSKIDPWGVALENYNALGQFRCDDCDPHALPEHQSVVIDPSTELRGGRRLSGFEDLQAYLLNERLDQFRSALASKLLAYALGRYLDGSDQPDIDAICAAAKANNDSLQAMVEAVVLTDAFLSK